MWPITVRAGFRGPALPARLSPRDSTGILAAPADKSYVGPQFNLDDLVRDLEAVEVCDADKTALLPRAVAIVRQDPNARGIHRLLAALAERGLLVPLLYDDGLSKEQAMELARAAARSWARLDLMIIRELNSMVDQKSGQIKRMLRLMDLLVPSRIYPSIVRLMHHPNQHIRSKAVLITGRGCRDTTWVRHHLHDTDERARANALESLWDVDSRQNRKLLESLVSEADNRVAGNAVLGLYRLGVPSAVSEVLRYAAHNSALFRSTAAWLIQETGDPRFTDTLPGLLCDRDAGVRKRAFQALVRLRGANAKAIQQPRCQITARLVAPDPSQTDRQLRLSVVGPNGQPDPDLLPTQISLWEDGSLVPRYRVVERAISPETASIVFLLPAGMRTAADAAMREAALRCLPWKRPHDLWVCQFYEPEAMYQGGTGAAQPCVLSSPGALRETLSSQFSDSQCPDLWRALSQAIPPQLKQSRGQYQVLVFLHPADNREKANAQLVTAISEWRALVQVLSCGPDAAVEDLCRRTNGVFHRLASPAEAEDVAALAYLHQFARYDVYWTPVNPNARNLKIRVHGPSLFGEKIIAVSPDPAV
jgi:hypothetical protein